MTHIKSLKVKGFKSFARETEIIFDKGFSCIIGPNGSGKSNVSDAILFVLGKLGSKSLRAENAASLIHNGGKGGRPSQEACVEICFDNSNPAFPMQEKEVRVARVVRQNGQSIYKINNNVKTRQEVLELLGKADISPTGHNIILQDTISRFVEINPEERRYIIEDIAGIGAYEERKEKSLRELDRTDEKLKEINIVLKERGNYLQNLEKERHQALLYKKLKDDIEIARAAIIFKQLELKKRELESFDKRTNAETEKLKKITTEISQTQSSLTSLTLELTELNKQIEKASGKALETELVQEKEEIASLLSRKSILEENFKTLEQRNKQLGKDLQNNLSTIEKLQEQISQQHKTPRKSRHDEILELENELFNTSENISEKIEQVKKARDRKDVIHLCSEIQNFCKNIVTLVRQLRKHRESPAAVEKFRDLEVEAKIAEREISSIKLLIKRNDEDIRKITSEVQNISEKVSGKKSEIKNREKETDLIKKNFQDFFSKRNSTEKKLREREQGLREKQSLEREIENGINNIRVDKAKIEEAVNMLSEEAKPFESRKEEALKISKNEFRLKEDIQTKQLKLEALGGINLRALEVYDEAKREFDEIFSKTQELGQEKTKILAIVDEINKKKKLAFLKTFNAIKEKFEEIFSRITTKGQAILELENKEDPFAEDFGVDIKIKLGKGKYLDTRSLSGGEKALTALAFIFSIQEFRPHPFYILDEVDSSLDKRNSEGLARLIESYVKKAQYICITHNDYMITAAEKLYGVSMQDGASKVLSLKL